MATIKLSALTEITSLASGDNIFLNDASDSDNTKRITISNAFTSLPVSPSFTGSSISIGDGTAQDLTITFNLDSNNTFIWDESADWFVLSDTLQVESGTVNNGLQLISTDSGAYASFQDNSTTDADQVLIGASGDDLVFASNGSFDMALTSTGLGLGVTSPTGGIDLETDEATMVLLTNTSNHALVSVNADTANKDLGFRFRNTSSGNGFSCGVDDSADAFVIGRGYSTPGGADQDFVIDGGNGNISIANNVAITGTLEVNDAFTFSELSSDPGEPDEGSAVLWMSDGTGKGDDGDVMIASNPNGTTKYGTLFDYSGGSAW
jgi:hypothetical protein